MKNNSIRNKVSPLALIVVIASVLLLLKLGFWQLQRADEKTIILQELDAKNAAKPIDLAALDTFKEKNHYHLKLRGELDNEHYLLLDNRIYKGMPGFEVLQLMKLTAYPKRSVLINRGWIPLPLHRENLPLIPEIKGQISVVGHVNIPTEAFVLKDEDLSIIKHWPKVIQSIDLDELTVLYSEYNKGLEPWVLRQDEDDDVFYRRHWININLSPQRHISYAVTWFGLALALIFIYIAAVRSRKEN